MTLPEFLIWETRQPDRFEFVGDQPLLLEPSTQARSLLIGDIVAILRPAVRGTGMRILPGIRVVVGREVRYPAVVVDAGPYLPEATEPSRPVMIVDVDRQRDWSALPDVRYLSMEIGDDVGQVSTLLRMRTK
ncbi:hypothetical protein AB4Z52_29390 [Rhizobium sp. 2YAF20]|uniref:hypothetical protein n=1 Tax=Rhizobium sp. 2YAF20 TaxID=3233027 RepID=UPI003F97C874